jgi:hypothetical protein
MEKLIAEINSNENLKNLEVFKSEFEIIDDQLDLNQGDQQAWFFWFSLPGCLPDSEPFGPFKTEIEALEHALDMFGY